MKRANRFTKQTRAQAHASGTYQRPEEFVGQVDRRTDTDGQAFASADFENTVNQQIAQSLQRWLG
ncbi:MAG: hypothetical protein ABI452_03585 [Candidatus Limnocylindrales bacterium]